jgi:hypothetical protein
MSLSACLLLVGLATHPAFCQAKTDWPMTAFDLSHDGYNSYETTISPSNVSNLKLKWSYNAADSGLTKWKGFRAQPVVATGVQVGGQSMDLVLIGNNAGTFFALDANSSNPAGSVVWSQSLGSVQPACPADGPAGIIGAAALDRSAQGGRGAVYVGNNGYVYAFDLASGALLPGWPVSIPNLSITFEGFLHAGLTLANGLLYVTNSSICEFDPWHGQIAVINTSTPTVVPGQWWTMSGSASLPSHGGGAIWGPGGVSVDPTPETGGIFVATGNGRPDGSRTETALYAEAIVELAPDLSQITAYHQPGYIINDDDIASTSLLFAPTGCPTPLLAAQRKSGELYVYRRNYIGLLRPQVLKVLNSPGTQWHGAPAWDPVAQLLLVTGSADGVAPFSGGLIALSMTANCKFKLAWQANTDLQGNPIAVSGTLMTPATTANGVAYIGVGSTPKKPAPPYKIYAIADQSVGAINVGQTLWESQPFGGTVEAAPVVTNGMVLIGTNDQHLYAYTLFGQ